MKQFYCGLTPAGHSVPPAPCSIPQFMYWAGQWVFLSLFVLSSVSQTAPFPSLVPVGPAVSLISSSWSMQCLPQAAVLSWACTSPKSTKSCFCASHRPYCCLYPSMVCPFLSSVTFLPLFQLSGNSRSPFILLFKQLLPLCIYIVDHPYLSLLCWVLSPSSGVNLDALNRILGLNLISLVSILSITLLMKILSSIRIKRHHVNPPWDLPC